MHNLIWMEHLIYQVDYFQDYINCFNLTEERFLWNIKIVEWRIFKHFTISHDMASSCFNLDIVETIYQTFITFVYLLDSH